MSSLLASEEHASPVLDVVRSGRGRPLDPAVKARMEGSFGHDFADVRVHTDDQASESARSVQALAYTVGNHVAFQSGTYAPGTTTGQRILAHELAHVIQQRSGPVDGTPTQGGISISHPSDRFEQAAEQAVTQVMDGRQAWAVDPFRRSSCVDGGARRPFVATIASHGSNGTQVAQRAPNGPQHDEDLRESALRAIKRQKDDTRLSKPKMNEIRKRLIKLYPELEVFIPEKIFGSKKVAAWKTQDNMNHRMIVNVGHTTTIPMTHVLKPTLVPESDLTIHQILCTIPLAPPWLIEDELLEKLVATARETGRPPTDRDARQQIRNMVVLKNAVPIGHELTHAALLVGQILHDNSYSGEMPASKLVTEFWTFVITTGMRRCTDEKDEIAREIRRWFSLGEDQKSKGEDQKSKGEDQKSKGEDQKSKGEDQKSKGEDQKSKGEDQKSKGEDQKSKGEDQKSKESKLARIVQAMTADTTAYFLNETFAYRTAEGRADIYAGPEKWVAKYAGHHRTNILRIIQNPM